MCMNEYISIEKHKYLQINVHVYNAITYIEYKTKEQNEINVCKIKRIKQSQKDIDLQNS